MYNTLKAIFDGREKRYTPEASKYFQYILQHGSSKLALHEEDICGELYVRRSYVATAGYYPSYIQPTEQQESNRERFLDLINKTLFLGLVDLALRLVAESHNNLSGTGGGSNINPQLTFKLLESLFFSLERYKIYSSESLKPFFENLIQRCLQTLPSPPTKPRGWAHKPRQCSDRNCADCSSLSNFLVSPDQQVWRFTAAEKRRKHIDSLLPYNLFKCDTDRSRSPYTLVVTKLGQEYAEEMSQYSRKVKDFEQMLAPLRHKYIKELLGDEDYNQLILLESRKQEEQRAVVTGLKRQRQPSDAAGGTIKPENQRVRR